MFDLVPLIKSVWYLGVSGIVFAESGLLIWFFLPGDSLLFTAWFLASRNFLDIKVLIIMTFICAVIGDSVWYAFGKKVWPKIFTKKDSLFFSKEHVVKAEKFFEKYGSKAVILARFMPIVRTFVPILAWVWTMKYAKFLTYNIIGGFLWTFWLCLLGYYLGNTIPDVDKYLLPIICLIIFLSILPGIIHYFKVRKK